MFFEPFSEPSPNRSVHDFLNELAGVQRLAHWSDEQTLDVVLTRLRGRALKIATRRLQPTDTLAIIKSKLLADFAPATNQLTSALTFLSASQRPDEKLSDFADRVLESGTVFFQSLGVVDQAIKDQHLISAFIKGVSESLKIFLSGKMFPDFEHCVKEAVQWSTNFSNPSVDLSKIVNLLLPDSIPAPSSSHSSKLNDISLTTNQLTDSLSRNTRAKCHTPRGKQFPLRFCTFCGKSNHFAATCFLMSQSYQAPLSRHHSSTSPCPKIYSQPKSSPRAVLYSGKNNSFYNNAWSNNKNKNSRRDSPFKNPNKHRTHKQNLLARNQQLPIGHSKTPATLNAMCTSMSEDDPPIITLY